MNFGSIADPHSFSADSDPAQNLDADLDDPCPS
jgi:hypothetical protein